MSKPDPFEHRPANTDCHYGVNGQRLCVCVNSALGLVPAPDMPLRVAKDPTAPAPSVDETARALCLDGGGFSETKIRAFLEAAGPEGRAAGMAGLEVGGEHGAA